MQKLKKPVIVLVFILALIFTRFYNLEKTARFIWDESSDLVNMHRIFVERQITMVGPISEQGDKVFGSLTYYMLLPFAVIGNFDPISPVYGAAFWSIATVFLIILLCRKLNPDKLYLLAVLSLIWFPLVDIGRWAWNPNLIPFWIVLGIILTLSKNIPLNFLGGVSMGLSIHHHYLSVFSIAAFGIYHLLSNLKKIKVPVGFIFGVLFSLLPFVIFDVTHPPGLFISRLLYFNHIDAGMGIESVFVRFAEIASAFRLYFFGKGLIGYLLVVLTLWLLISDVRERNKSLKYAFSWLSQLVLLVLIVPFNTHYLIPSVGFFLAWLIVKRKKSHSLLINIIMGGIIVSSASSFYSHLTTYNWMADIKSTRIITGVIVNEIRKKDLKNVNIAVIASPDQNTYGRKFRDLLLLKNIRILDKDHYDITDNLFVVSSSSEEKVRSDSAYEISRFKEGRLVEKYAVEDSLWYVYLFERS